MIDFLRHVQREEDAARSTRMRPMRDNYAEQALDGYFTAETEELCEMLELALATCDYEYMAANVRKLAGTLEALPCVERMSVECLTEDCPASVQERILTVLECLATEGVSSCEFVRALAKSAMCVVADGKRGKVIQCILRCFGVIAQNSEFGVEIARNVDMSLIISCLDVRAYEDDVVYFIKETTNKGLPQEMLNWLVGMVMCADLSAGRVKACAWMILVDERAIECIDLRCFVEAAMMCEDLGDQMKLLVLSLAYENIPEFGDVFLRDLFPFLHSSNKYLVATALFAISCYLETHSNGGNVLMEAAFLEHVDWDQPFIVKRECARCLCRLIATVGASYRPQLATEEIVTHLMDVIGNDEKDLSLLIIGTLTSMADDPVMLAFIQSSLPEVLDDADLTAAMQRLMNL